MYEPIVMSPAKLLFKNEDIIKKLSGKIESVDYQETFITQRLSNRIYIRTMENDLRRKVQNATVKVNRENIY